MTESSSIERKDIMIETKELICINCPLGCMLTAVRDEAGQVTVTGHTCPRGEAYGKNELTDPRRVVTSIVRIKGRQNQVVSVKTAEAIPKDKIQECMKEIKKIEVDIPVKIGDIVIEDVAGTGVAVVATREA